MAFTAIRNTIFTANKYNSFIKAPTAKPDKAAQSQKPQRRNVDFSKSRNEKVDDGLHYIMTTHDSQTFFRMCGDFRL
jgi:hypothetical protein